MQNDCWRTFWYGITMYNSHRLVTLDLHWLPVVSVSCSSDGTMALPVHGSRGSATVRQLWAQGLHSEEAAELVATLTTSWERPIGLQLQPLQLLGTKKTRGWFLVISWFSWSNIDILFFDILVFNIKITITYVSSPSSTINKYGIIELQYTSFLFVVFQQNITSHQHHISSFVSFYIYIYIIG